ncbi:MAG: hypothetical protein ACRDG5_09955, partial [Anaerolineales bacterium]
MEDQSQDRPPLKERIKLTWQTTRSGLFFATAVLGTLLALSLPNDGTGGVVGLEANEVASQDILAPYAVSYTSEVLTEQARQSAAASVPETFDPPDVRVARAQVDQLQAALEEIGAVRADSTASRQEKIEELTTREDIRIVPTLAERILTLSDSRWEAVRLESVAVLQQVMQREIREGRLEEARRTIPTLVSMSLPESQVELVVLLARGFLAPNARWNEAATQAAREEAARAVAAVVKSYAAGETVISRGEIVTPGHVEALRVFGLLEAPAPSSELAVRALLTTLLACTLALFIARTNPEPFRKGAAGWVLVGGFIAVALAMQLMIPGHAVLPYVFPAATLPMLLAVIFGPGVAVASALVQGALAGYLAGRGLEIALYFMLSGTIGALAIGRAERLSLFFWSGLAADLAGIAVLVIFRFPDPGMDVIGKGFLLLGAVLSGLFSASLCFVLLLLVGNFLGIPTTLQLIELSRPD